MLNVVSSCFLWCLDLFGCVSVCFGDAYCCLNVV